MNEEIKIGDEVVFNDPALDMAGKWEVVSTHFGSIKSWTGTNDGQLSLGVRPARKLNNKIKYINSGWATRTGATYDHSSLLDILSVPKRRT